MITDKAVNVQLPRNLSRGQVLVGHFNHSFHVSIIILAVKRLYIRGGFFSHVHGWWSNSSSWSTAVLRCCRCPVVDRSPWICWWRHARYPAVPAARRCPALRECPQWPASLPARHVSRSSCARACAEPPYTRHHDNNNNDNVTVTTYSEADQSSNKVRLQ